MDKICGAEQLCVGCAESTPQGRTAGAANVLPLSRVRPYRTRLRDATRRAVRAAEAAGQQTAARRLLRRVGRQFAPSYSTISQITASALALPRARRRRLITKAREVVFIWR